MRKVSKRLILVGIALVVSLSAFMVGCTCGTPTTPPAPTLSSVAVTPTSPGELAVGGTQQFTAIGTYSNGTTSDITSQATWASSDTSVAKIIASGLASGIAAGTTNIMASLSGIVSPAVTLTVIIPEPTLSSIAVTPETPDELVVGSTRQFTATATYSDNSTADVTAEVTWVSSEEAVATISALGLATGVAEGTTNITASLSEVMSPATSLTVIPAPTLTSITVTNPSASHQKVGDAQQLTATGTYSDDSTADISSEVTWTSSNSDVAIVSNSGLVTAVAEGTSEITAVLGEVTSPAITLTVAPVPDLTSITVTPESPENLAVGSTLQFTATGTYSDDSTADITSRVTWASSNTNIATISSTGLSTGVAAGTTNITAALSEVNSSAVALNVVPVPTLTSIAITPASPAGLAVGATHQFVATGTYSDGSTADISAQVIWTSSDTNVATISASGLVTGVTAGTTDITVSLSGTTSTAVTLTVV